MPKGSYDPFKKTLRKCFTCSFATREEKEAKKHLNDNPRHSIAYLDPPTAVNEKGQARCLPS